MELELVPPAPEPDHDAVRWALLAAGVALEQSAPAYAAAWRAAALAEAVECEADVYALSPRSTRGATLA